MIHAPTQDHIELEVKDFGPIVEANVDLRPLTVFIGPSNTGKSWLATLIYALHRCFGEAAGPELWRAAPGSLLFRDGEARGPVQEELEKFARNAGMKLLLGGSSKNEEGLELPGVLLDEIRTLFNARGALFAQEIGRCLGLDGAGALSRRGSDADARIVVRRRVPEDSRPRDEILTFGIRGAALGDVVLRPFRISHDELDDIVAEFLQSMGRGILDAIVDDQDQPDFFNRGIIAILEMHIRDRVAGSLTFPAHYLPADRTGVLHAHQALVGGIIRNAPRAGRDQFSAIPRLTGVLTDFLQQIIEIDQSWPPNTGPMPELASQIEETILGGSVHVRRSDLLGSPDFIYRPKGWDNALRLTNASSMVSDLTPMVLYLRHLAKPGTLLIVEEPESSLHPAMQVELVRRLASVVRDGVRIIVTTHSEWVLEALANIVRSSKLPETRRKKLASEEFALRPEQVGAWLFQSQDRLGGTKVTEVHLDDSGLYPSGFDRVATALHNEWAEISSLLGEAE